ncbi:MAG TPA: hypothetical protein VFP72_00365 [Kineosporiaceae bacterium]|nr:hypothetical protein [Kineosporiaceae bacterium]
MRPPRRRRSVHLIALAVVSPLTAGLLLAAFPSSGGAPGQTAVLTRPVTVSTTLTVPSTVTIPGPVALPWPAAGQTVLAVQGLGTVGSSGQTDRRVPIASVAKVMTAYVLLRDHPLGPGDDGPALVVSPAEAAAYAGQAAGLQSLVKVAAGERITLRQALQALLIASADNMAQILARWDAGSPQSFVAKMNAAAAELGMGSTRYTDPSGLDAGTVSTAADQLILARRVLDVPELMTIAGQSRAVIPVAGTIRNYNTLLGQDGIIGIKTGSTTPAGGCLMFAAQREVGGRVVTLYGVMLGQPGTRSTILPNVLAATHALVTAAGPMVQRVALVRAGQIVAVRTGPDGRRIGLVPGGDVSVVGWPGQVFSLEVSSADDGTVRLGVRDGAGAAVTTVPLIPHG